MLHKLDCYLWDCTRAAPPCVKHDSILMAFLQHLILIEQTGLKSAKFEKMNKTDNTAAIAHCGRVK